MSYDEGLAERLREVLAEVPDAFKAHIRSLQQIIDSGTDGGSVDEK